MAEVHMPLAARWRSVARSAREAADTEDLPDPQRLPEELSRREKLKAKLDRASAELERRAKARAERERAQYERKLAAREKRRGRRKGREIKPPREEPRAEEQINTTDADSTLMRKNQRAVEVTTMLRDKSSNEIILGPPYTYSVGLAYRHDLGNGSGLASSCPKWSH